MLGQSGQARTQWNLSLSASCIKVARSGKVAVRVRLVFCKFIEPKLSAKYVITVLLLMRNDLMTRHPEVCGGEGHLLGELEALYPKG